MTTELNEVEQNLNRQGYTLRDSKRALYHEHQPDQSTLMAQARRVEAAAQIKPKRAPLSSAKLRAKVRDEAKPPRARPTRLAPTSTGYFMQGPQLDAAAIFGWTPSLGEAGIASAFLDARANFSGSLGGLNPGLHGQISIQAGGYVLGNRVEFARVDATLDVPPDGTYEAKTVVSFPDGSEYPIYSKQGTQPIKLANALDLFDSPLTLHTKVPIVGYPIDVDITLTPKLTVDANAQLTETYIIGELTPKLRVDATIEAYVNMFLVQAGAGGNAVLIDAAPTLSGAAYYSETAEGGQANVQAFLMGHVKMRFLQGHLYSFVDVGYWPLEKRFTSELWNYPGWSYDRQVFEWDRSDAP